MDVLGMNPVTVTHANYPVHDMTNLNAFDSGAYDFVVSDMVLEHVEGNPFDAIDSCLRVLGSGGIAVHTTVFSYPIHNVPGDYWRFTPMALSLMHRSWSLVDVGAWGNFDAISAIHDDDQWSAVPGDSEHPRHILATDNDPNWPIVTWVIASK